MNLYLDGSMDAITAKGQKIIFRTQTDYPVNGRILIEIDLETSEKFELLLRIPTWSKQTSLSVNGESFIAEQGYMSIDREWSAGDILELVLDMRTEALKPTPYGHQVLMNKVIWGANYVIPTYDEEDSLAKHHIALRRGPIILAQENRLGYSVDEPVSILIGEDGYVHVIIPETEIAPYEHMLEVEVPLKDGCKMHVTDYSSAGKLWTEESKMAAWILIEKEV